jgi:predicted dehydrogenase
VSILKNDPVATQETAAQPLPLRVGLVGANTEQSWAKFSHIPAIETLANCKLTAVATSKIETAREAGAVFGVDEYYASASELAQSENVELVSVCVKVSHHRDLVFAALDAGKPVLCEWPLALSVEEAEEMTERAEQAGVNATVNLQGRMSPAARLAHEAIASGSIGQPLTASILSTTSGFGSQSPQAYAYMYDPAQGATLSTVTAGHTLDLAIYLLGGIGEIAALTTIKYKSIELTDAPGEVVNKTPDYLAIQARFENDCVLSVEVDSGRAMDDVPFIFKIIGTKGQLTLKGGSIFGFQGGELTLEATVPLNNPEPPASPELKGPLANVGEMYACLARDLRTGEKTTPSFGHGTKLHKLIRSIGIAAESGDRQKSDDWPTE